MIITINKKDYDLKFGFKAMLIYEKITGKTFSPEGLESLMIALYSSLLACDNNFSTSFDEFCNWLDEDPDIITKFTNLLIETTNARTEIVNSTEEEVNEGKDLSKND